MVFGGSLAVVEKYILLLQAKGSESGLMMDLELDSTCLLGLGARNSPRFEAVPVDSG